LEELRDTHRLESSSQSDQIERLRQQLAESEALLKTCEEGRTQTKAEADQLRVDLEKAKGVAKEEEEKGTKAITLLKTVRTNLVKTKKEKEEAVKELATIKEREKEEREKERQERAKLEAEVERVKVEKEKEVAILRSQLEKELGSVKERYEKENAARKGQYELEVITTKVYRSITTHVLLLIDHRRYIPKNLQPRIPGSQSSNQVFVLSHKRKTRYSISFKCDKPNLSLLNRI